MYHAYHSEGFVIGSRASGPGSKSVLIYTRTLGLVSGMAQSAREERSKLRPHLLEYCTGMYTLVRGKDVWRVTGADGAHNLYFDLRGSSRAQLLVARLFSLVRRLVQGEEPNEKLFATLQASLDLILAHRADEELLANIEIVSVLRMLAALGYIGDAPQLKDILSTQELSLAMCDTVPQIKPEALKAINAAFAAAQL